MNKLEWLKPAWTLPMLAVMVAGFMVWWPLGLATIAYIIWGDELVDLKTEAARVTNGALGDAWRRTSCPVRRTGNVAFDEWRNAEIDRLAEERRRLDEMRGEFDEYIAELRKARDNEEFDRFMKARKGAKKASRRKSADSEAMA